MILVLVFLSVDSGQNREYNILKYPRWTMVVRSVSSFSSFSLLAAALFPKLPPTFHFQLLILNQCFSQDFPDSSSFRIIIRFDEFLFYAFKFNDH